MLFCSDTLIIGAEQTVARRLPSSSFLANAGYGAPISLLSPDVRSELTGAGHFYELSQVPRSIGRSW